MQVYKVNRDAVLANELLELIEARKVIERREKELKQYFKTKLDNIGHDTASLGGVLISLVTKERRDLDKKSLKAHFGDLIKSFEKTTRYLQVDVKPISPKIGKIA